MEYVIDAKEKSLGRVASEAAMALRGKNDPSFAPNKLSDVWVTIKNTGTISVTEKKLEQKTYTRYSGYPGGLYKQSLSNLVDKKGYSEAMRKAVYGMLPNNRLRSRMMKRLTIEE
ncbi:MAG: 50S ribosomal protein L13 [bacterium]|nr:50S ribosomal protein L13 [bacterium]